ncbi:MAG: methyltransferase [Candidatus Eisenbacteria bacterium]
MARQPAGAAAVEMGRSYQAACVVLAAAELDLFTALAKGPLRPDRLADAIGGDPRATEILADALVALGLTEKKDGAYALSDEAGAALTEGDPGSVLPMLRHQANCLRSWARLAEVVRTGRPVDTAPSVRGGGADHAAFIEAMEVASREAAPKVVAALGPPSFKRLLDVGGGPATWTIAFLRAVPGGRATLFDLPAVIPIARNCVAAANLADRIDFVAGSAEDDAPLPSGFDLAWVSAFVHQNSREENRRLFAKVHAALVPGGSILIRDIVMNDAHTSPPGGALFAVNMLVRTIGGGTYSLSELADDLRTAGFGAPDLLPGERDMDQVVCARRG